MRYEQVQGWKSLTITKGAMRCLLSTYLLKL